MAIRTVLKLGNPVLRQVAQPVTEFATPSLRTLLGDMYDTMAAHNGAGLAAPQIGVGLRVVIFCVEENPRYPGMESVPDTVLINPRISPLVGEMETDWEGCLSVPGLRGMVPRYKKISYSGYDEKGELFERTAEGFHARVVQHEVDHLDGILYPYRMTSLDTLGFEDELFPDTDMANRSGLSVE